MARKRRPWHVDLDPSSRRFTFFISHVGEDAAEVETLRNEITRWSGRGTRPELSCFIDVYNWPIANDIRPTIQDNLLRSEYMVAWITPRFLASTRGWVWFELAYAELIEASLNDLSGPRRANYSYIVPYFSPEVQVDGLHRNPLLRYWERKLYGPHESHTISDIARKLVDFYEQETLKRGGSGPSDP